jgi:two-component system, NarL family, response regulator NreC
LTRTKRIYKIMLADGHTLFRRGLRTLLATETDLEVVAEMGSIDEALAVAKLLTPDVLVMDLKLLAAAGADADAPAVTDAATVADVPTSLALRQIAATTGLLFLTSQDTPQHLEEAIAAGARGYMLKNSAPAQLVAGIRIVAQQDDQNPGGLSLLTPDLKALAASNNYARASVLTLREQEVMRLLAEGRTVREVAAELSLSIKTIEAHKLNLMRKLDIHNRTSLIESALRMGLLVPQVEAAL